MDHGLISMLVFLMSRGLRSNVQYIGPWLDSVLNKNNIAILRRKALARVEFL